MTDWSRQHECIWATQVRGGQGLGRTVVGWTGVGPVGFTDTIIISEWDPLLRCVVRHTGRVVRGSGIFEVIPTGQESEFRWTEDWTCRCRPRWPGWPGWSSSPSPRRAWPCRCAGLPAWSSRLV